MEPLRFVSNRPTSTATGFRAKLREAGNRFNPEQRAGVEMRTSLLDSYLNESMPDVTMFFGKGDLVIVDLSDPFLARTSPISRLTFIDLYPYSCRRSDAI